jgi:DNA-3-methyladenine glycosylase I
MAMAHAGSSTVELAPGASEANGICQSRERRDTVAEMSYCDIAPGHPLHGPYHAKEYGFPIRDDRRLFERLALEINQAGLSWLTILKKRRNFYDAFDGFDIDRVAGYGQRERARLLRDQGIIRNQLKIDAVIENARRLVAIRESHRSFARWLDAHHPLEKEEWVKLFKKTFLFTGGEITGEFLISTGYLPGAHVAGCPVYHAIAKKNPPWMR